MNVEEVTDSKRWCVQETCSSCSQDDGEGGKVSDMLASGGKLAASFITGMKTELFHQWALRKKLPTVALGKSSII